MKCWINFEENLSERSNYKIRLGFSYSGEEGQTEGELVWRFAAEMNSKFGQEPKFLKIDRGDMNSKSKERVQELKAMKNLQYKRWNDFNHLINFMKLFTIILIFSCLATSLAEPLDLGKAYLATDSSKTGALQGSLEGGTEIIIEATGLVHDPTLYNIFIGDFPCEIPAEGIQSSFISCKTTAVSSTTDVKDLPITVYFNTESFEVENRNFDYLAGLTPLLSYVYPTASAPGSKLYFFGKHRVADVGDGKRNFGDVLGMYVGEDQCMMFDIVQTYAGNTNSFDKLICTQSPGQEAGKYDVKEWVKSGYSQTEEQIRPTNFENQYYEHIVVPTVESVSPSIGLLGGHEIKITGSGFSSYNERNEVTVDGLPCVISESTAEEIICNRAPKTDASTTQLETDSGSQSNGWISGSGFRYWKYEMSGGAPSSYSGWKTALDNGDSFTEIESGIRNELWYPSIDDNGFAIVFKGYFYAPATGDYTFSGYADDNFGLYVSDEYGSKSVSSSPLIYTDSYMNEQENLFYNNRSTAMGGVKSMVSGRYYYMELYAVNNAGSGHVKIRVEVPNTDETLKWKRYEVNNIQTSFTNEPEIIEFTLSNVDASVGGEFNITHSKRDPATLQTTTQHATLAYNATLSQFVSKIDDLSIFNYGVTGVSSEVLDATGNAVAAGDLTAVTFKWTISLWKLRSSEVVSEPIRISIVSINPQATLTANVLTPHGPLISGTFSILIDNVPVRVYDSTSGGYDNANIPYNVGQGALANAFKNILNTDFVTVKRTGLCEYSCKWVITFDKLDLDVPDLVVSAAGLTGGQAGTLPEIEFVEDQKFSTNLVFNPVPHSLMFTDAPALNVHVKTNGILASCTGSCEYVINANSAEITAQTLAGASVTVAMSNPQSWTYTTSDLVVKVGGKACTISSGTLTSFVCDLETNSDNSPVLVAGEYNVQVLVSDLGEVPIQDGVSAMTYGLTLSSSTPNSGQTNGGYSAVLTGNGFPSSADDVTITICGGKAVFINDISNTEITVTIPKCSTEGADSISVTYNSETVTTAFTYSASTMASTINSVSPSSGSPVLKQIMTITGSGFGTDENAVKVRLVNLDMPKFYPMRILSISDTEIKCGIPGGLAGQYDVQVTIIGVGDAIPSSDSADDFVYELVVSSISPTTGSYNGGTLVTIAGRNFSPNDAENIVFVGDELNWFCAIESFTTTQIQCRMPKYHPDWTSNDHQVTVTSKIIQDSTCEGSCTFTYSNEASSPSLSSLSTQGSFSGTGSLTLTGTNFDLISSADVRVAFENTVTKEIYEVTPTSVTATSIVCDIPSVPAANYNVRARLDPNGESNSLALKIKSKFEPTTLSGSVMGGEIVLSGKGFPEEWPSTLFTLTMSSNNVFVDVNVASVSTEEIRIKVGPGTNSYTIKLEDPTDAVSTATFTQSGSATPILTLDTTTATAGSSMTVGLTQTSLLTASPSKVFIYNVLDEEKLTQVPAGSLLLNSPFVEFPHIFRTGSYGIKPWYDAYGWGEVSSFLTVTAASDFTASATTSSFLGGQLTVTGAFISEEAELKVGGMIGKVISVTDSAAVFAIPPLVTPSVIVAYPELDQAKKLVAAAVISDGGSAPEKVNDHFTSTAYSSTAATCYIGVDLGEGIEANIRRVRYFPTMEWTIAGSYIKGAVFEGSSDGSTYTTIGEVDETVHAGWNSILVETASNFRYVRLSHDSTSGCKLAEIEVFGVEMSDATVSDVTSFTTSAQVTDGQNSYTLTDVVEYRADKTPTITAVSQKVGSIYGGETLTLTGTNLDIGTASVSIDGIECVVNAGATSATSLECVTGERLALPSKTSFEVTVGGNVALIKQKFEYVMRWSDKRTWGTDMPPVEDDLVVIPEGMALYVDETTPRLLGITVDGGKIIFADEGTPIEVHTGFITVNGGEFVAGTQENPYQGSLTFVMYGEYQGKQLPLVGNKGIGCVKCKLSMYGKERSKTWTTIATTISPGDSAFTVSEAVDWAVGEEIVIASTDFDHNHAERRFITAVSGNDFTVDAPFQYQHVSVVETYDGVNLPMEAEVGLLTRNIKMKGDDSSTTIDGEYGSHLMIAGSAEEGAQGHVAYTEFFHCGQPRIVGRYCIHFHMNGDVSNSFVKGNAVHDSFARILTIHAVQYLHVSHNVGFRCKGHNFFIEDGVETQNVLEYNLVISALVSFNMMTTDTSVAAYWVTNPTNHLRYNRAAGGDFYGFWYEIKEHPDGPSASVDICPIGNPLGESHDNLAHSFKRFGLRIFHLYSRETPCKSHRNNALEDPFSENPSIQARFYNYILYKNGEAGLLAEFTGNNLYENFVIAENKMAGMEFYVSDFADEPTEARNVTIVGLTANNAEPSEIVGAKGVIMPRSDRWKMSNVKFFNYPVGTTVMKTCAKCDDALEFINRYVEYEIDTTTFTNISGDYLKFNGIFKNQIIYDKDGSLSSAFDGGSRSSASLVWNFPHLAVETDCAAATDSAKWGDGLLCDSTLKVRGARFTSLQPAYDFKHIEMFAQKIDSPEQNVSADSTSFSGIFSEFASMEPMDTPFSHSLPFVTGRIYNIWFGTGLDFTHMAFETSNYFDDADDAIIFKFNYTENRELYEVGHLVNNQISGMYINKTEGAELDVATCEAGDYTHDNDIRVFTVCATSRGEVQARELIDVSGVFCRYLCPAPTGEFEKEDFVRVWSNATQWPGEVLPAAGQNVTIPGPWTVLMDVDPAEMEFWQIDGRVIIPKTNTQVHLKAKGIWIRAGELETEKDDVLGYHPGQITIELMGNKSDRGYTISPELGGNKIFANTGILKLYGKAPSTQWSRLKQIAHVGDTTISVSSANGWAVGDELALGPSYSKYQEHEKVTITAISGTTITISPALQYNHYGASGVTINNEFGTLDARTAVGHLSRGIKIIQSGQNAAWGFRMDVYGFEDTYFDQGLQDNVTVVRTGSVDLSGVEFYQGGQYDTEKAALSFENAVGSEDKKVQKSVFHGCGAYCMRVDNSLNMNIKNNVFYDGKLFHVRALGISKFDFQNNLMIAALPRPTAPGAKDLISCFASWEPVHDKEISIKNNLCQGSAVHGYAFPNIPCESMDDPPYASNTAGSTGAAFIFTQVSGSCVGATGMRAYASQIAHITSGAGPDEILIQDVISADCGRGVTLRFGKEGSDKTARFKNAFITAISRPTCSECYGSSAMDCSNNQGMRMLAVTVNGESLPDKFGTGFDVICKTETFDAKAFLENVVFQNFNQEYSELPQCSNNVIFKAHSLAGDLVGSHHLTNVKCNNCSADAYAYFIPPIEEHLGWFGGCGELYCTGFNNYFIQDWTGDLLGFEGTLLANNSVIGDNEDGCVSNENLNGHICERTDFAVLEYESIAPDRQTRTMWPAYLKYDGSAWNSTTNAYREWEWQGSEPLNRRLARFISVVVLQNDYNLTFASEPPADMRFQFQRRKYSEGENDKYIIVRLHYPRPNSIRVMARDTVVKPITLRDNNAENGLDTSVCGSNKYFYFNNTVHFVVTGAMGCMVRVSLTTSLQLSARFSMDINSFFSAGGETKFVDRLCALLGITDTSRVKIVGVYSGSVIVNAVIDATATTMDDAPSADANAEAEEMSELQAALVGLVDNGTLASDMDDNGLTGLEDLESAIYTNLDNSSADEEEEEVVKKNKVALIVGITVGAVVILGFVIAALVYVLRKRAPIHEAIESDDVMREEKSEDSSNYNNIIKVRS